MIGQTISHYRILAKLGEGGMGVVYRAEDLDLHVPRALKFLPPHAATSDEDRARLEREARAAASLEHPAICPVHEIGRADGHVFIVMSYLEGRTLAERLEADGPLPVDEAVAIASELAGALARAHEAGIVHRDLKPGNVMLTPDGQPVLMDFGLARVHDRTRLTVTGATLGTPRYMAPEQTRGDDADPRTDLWSLGATLYEALAGRPPFGGAHEQAVVYAILNASPAPLTDLRREIPLALERVVDRCLQKDPARRYQGADELLADLHGVRDALAAGLTADRFAGLRRLRRRRRLLAGLATAFGLLVVAVGTWLAVLQDRRIDAIAVLPVLDMSGGETETLFADGLTEGLITELQRLCGAHVRVVGRTSVMHFRGTELSLPEIARELGVDALVEAALVRAGEKIRVAAKLMRAQPEEQLWAASFEREVRDVLALHGDIARTVAEEVQVALAPEDVERLQGRREVSPEAYELCIEGQNLLNDGTADGLKQSVDVLERAVALEPEYVEALAALANSRAALACQGHVHPNEGYPEARKLLNRALALDPDSPEALAALGHVTWECDWDFQEAERLFRRALDVNPSYALARHMLGFFLCMTGRRNEGVRELERALRNDPLSARLNADMGFIYAGSRDTTRAIRRLQQTEARFPGWDPVSYHLRRAVWRGNYDAAIGIAETLRPGGRYTNLCFLHALKGDTARARSYVDSLVAHADTVYVPPMQIAVSYARIGDIEAMLAWYERALEIRDPRVVRFRGLVDHPDPRVAALAARVGFP